MILKTYARVFVAAIEPHLNIYEKLVGKEADLRFNFGDVEIAAVGDFLLVAGPESALEPLRGTIGPVIVQDLNMTIDDLVVAGAHLVAPPDESATGTYVYLRHPDGALVEYVQWKPELVTRILN